MNLKYEFIKLSLLKQNNLIIKIEVILTYV